MSHSANPYASPSESSSNRRLMPLRRRIRRLGTATLVAVLFYVLSYAPIYWIVNALGIRSEAVWIALGLFYLPIWLLAQVTPLDSIIMWYWEFFMPPIEGW